MKVCQSLLLSWAVLWGCSALSVGQESATATPTEKPAETTTEKPAETSAEKPADPTTEKSAEKPAEKPSEKPAEKAEGTAKKSTETPESKLAVRVVALAGQYVDQLEPGAFDPTSLLTGGLPEQQRSFYKLCEALEEIAQDKEVDALLLDLSDSSISMNGAQLDEFLRHLSKFKQSKKPTVAWLESADNTHLAIAAACDHVLMADMGIVDLPSASMQTMFFKDAMDLVGVQASVVRAGDFKGAVEPYLNPVMSDHLRDHYKDMLKSINDAMVSRIATGRGLTVAAVRELQSQRVLLPQEALTHRLVDELAPFGSMQQSVEKHLGSPVEWITAKTKAKKPMSFFELMGKVMAGPQSDTSKTTDNSLAVLHMNGTIMDGKKAMSGMIVSGPMVKAIDELANDKNVKGVVVRINSPGGSATASEAIRQALVGLAKKKPVVVSMGSVAASGGYWISCLGEPVYAERATMTGSIGVFSMKLNFGSLMRRIGVHVESITLDDSAAVFAIDRSWSETDVKTMQKVVDQVYTQFLDLVSDSRKLPVEKIAPLAGGRVWSGEQAQKLGLVDSIGGLDDCLQVIAKKAELSKYKVIHRPVRQSGLELLELFGSPEEDDVAARSAIQTALQALQLRGIPTETTRQLLNDSLTRGNSRPAIWALHPAELLVD